MKNNVTELVCILDRSGSMSGLVSDTIGGFNALIEKQKKEDGECLVSTVLFNTRCDVLHDRVPIDAIPPMTTNDYMPGGGTALLDAIGRAIRHIGGIHKYARRADVPEHTIFVITTDGMENASRRYGSNEVKRMIKRQQERYGWEFIFLAANIDAVETAGHIGISARRAACYCADSAGTERMFRTAEMAIGRVRRREVLEDDWARDLEEDARRARG